MKSYPRSGVSMQESVRMSVRIPARAARARRKGRPAPGGDAAGPLPVTVDAAKRRELIAEAAYYREEKRGFSPGGEIGDWLEAEAEVRQLLGP